MVSTLVHPADVEGLCLENDDKQSFGIWVRRMRETRGLSLRGLASKAGVTHPTLSGIENNQRGTTRDMVRAIATGLDVPVSDAIRAWLEDEAQEGGAILYVTDRETAAVAEAFGDLPQALKGDVKGLIQTIAEISRQAKAGDLPDVTIDELGKAISASGGELETYVRDQESEFLPDDGSHPDQILPESFFSDPNKN